jgi:hypothetical protein
MKCERMLVTAGEYPFDVWAEIRAVGDDIDIIVGGGEKPHIGGVALAEPAVTVHPVTGETVSADEGTESGFSRIAVLSAAGHKDVAIAEMFAATFCSEFGVRVAAGSGVHIDDATEEMIEQLMDTCSTLLGKSLEAWRSAQIEGTLSEHADH